MSHPARYVADLSWAPEQQRLGALELSLDPVTKQHLNGRGLAKGWRCLEVGAGSGSIARWLAGRVGPAGKVLAVDIDTQLLDGPNTPNLEVRRLDILRDPLPEADFDLVHARLVLGHLRDHESALRRMVRALKRGGTLLVEEADFLWTDVGRQPIDPVDAEELFFRVWRPTVAFLKGRGYDGHLGRRLPSALRAQGLLEVGGEARTLIGDANLTRAMQLTIERFAPDLIAADLASTEDLDAVKRLLLRDDVVWTSSPIVSVWGRRAGSTEATGSHTFRRSPAKLDEQLEEELAELDAQARRRRLVPVEGRLGPRMKRGQRDVWMFAGANYLDLSSDARVVAAARAALVDHGAAAGGARLICGDLPVHEALERELAEFLGCEAALLFSTGYMANLGVLTALAGPQDLIVSDELNHASLVDACRLSGARIEVFPHGRADKAREALLRGGGRRRLLVTDGVYSMDGDVAPLRDLVSVARECGAIVVLDDTHGIGVLGTNGRGSAELAGVADEIDLFVGNLGKAFGSFGAFVAASSTVRDYLVNRARAFIFTCALPPASVAAARAALKVVRAEPDRRQKLLDRAARLRTGLQSLGYDTGASSTHVVPVIVGDDRGATALAAQVLERGFYTQAIRYPSVPANTARLRLTPMATHEPAQIEELLGVFAGLRPASSR